MPLLVLEHYNIHLTNDQRKINTKKPEPKYTNKGYTTIQPTNILTAVRGVCMGVYG